MLRLFGLLGAFCARLGGGGAWERVMPSGRRCRKSMQNKNRTRLFSDSVSGIKWN